MLEIRFRAFTLLIADWVIWSIEEKSISNSRSQWCHKTSDLLCSSAHWPTICFGLLNFPQQAPQGTEKIPSTMIPQNCANSLHGPANHHRVNIHYIAIEQSPGSDHHIDVFGVSSSLGSLGCLVTNFQQYLNHSIPFGHLPILPAITSLPPIFNKEIAQCRRVITNNYVIVIFFR